MHSGKWDRIKITERVCWAADNFGSTNPQQQQFLLHVCSNSSQSEVFAGLFAFFSRPELQVNQYERQALAGKVLYKVLPFPALELEDSVYSIAPHWNLSVEELPWYWCKAYGQLEVIRCLQDINRSCREPELKRALETLLYWSKMFVSG